MIALDAAVLVWLYEDATTDPRELASLRRGVVAEAHPGLTVGDARRSLRRLRDRGLVRHENHGQSGQWWELTREGVQLLNSTLPEAVLYGDRPADTTDLTAVGAALEVRP